MERKSVTLVTLAVLRTVLKTNTFAALLAQLFAAVTTFIAVLTATAAGIMETATFILLLILRKKKRLNLLVEKLNDLYKHYIACKLLH